jgi:hypothetical protein
MKEKYMAGYPNEFNILYVMVCFGLALIVAHSSQDLSPHICKTMNILKMGDKVSGINILF